MKVRSDSLNTFVVRGIAILCPAILLGSASQIARAAGVVGTGTAASCTDAALNAALAGAGLVTFNCGATPVTIDISTGTGTKMIAADTTIDGGKLITISGGNHVGVFIVYGAANFIVENLTIANGFGGGIANLSGSLTVTNSTFSGNRAPGGAPGAEEGGSSGYGGGLYNYYDAILTVTNSAFFDNNAHLGGGIANFGR